MSVRVLSKTLEKKAQKELNETANKLEDIKSIREWTLKQPHLTARTDDQWLLAFLRGCKFSLQQTKEKLDTFYTVRKLMPEFFSNRDPFDPAIQETLKLGIFALLPTAASDPSGPRMFMTRGQNADPSKASATTIIKLFFMAFDILLLEDDNFTVGGLYSIIDLYNVPYKYATQLTLDFGKKMFMCLQNVYPIRIRQILYINTPPFYVTFYNIIKFLLKEKIKERTLFADQNKIEEMEKYISPSILPKEYGGDGPSFDELAGKFFKWVETEINCLILADFKRKIESYREWFLKDEANCTDETKRIGKSNIVDDMLGIDGSFRKLDID